MENTVIELSTAAYVSFGCLTLVLYLGMFFLSQDLHKIIKELKKLNEEIKKT